MGNHNGKENHVPSGSPLDFFQTPPTTPTQAELTAMALSSAAPPDEEHAPSPPGGTTTTATSSLVAEWTQKLSASPPEWAVDGPDAEQQEEVEEEEEVEEVEVSPTSQLRVSSGSMSDLSWQERDSGLETQAAAESAGEEMTLVLLSLMEHYRPSLGLTPNTDVTTGAVELLRRLITEREELVEEVETLTETLRTERLEWHQFQSDLQVAVSVADRLRVESEQALGSVQERQRAVEEQLARALEERQETERQLQSLRDQHRDVCHKVSQLQQQGPGPVDVCHKVSQLQQPGRGPVDVCHKVSQLQQQGPGPVDVCHKVSQLQQQRPGPVDVCHKVSQLQQQRPGPVDVCHKVSQLQQQRPGPVDVCHKVSQLQQQRPGPVDVCRDEDGRESEEGRREEAEKLVNDADAKDEDEVSEDAAAKDASEDESECGDVQLRGRGVAESYLRRLAALEKKKKKEEGRGPRDPRKMLAERSWSLSRLPFPNDPTSQKDASRNTSTTLPLCKKEEPNKVGRPDRSLKRQDSWSNFYTGKQDEDPSSDSVRPLDGFSALLRRHGGSRRNSLLRWSQSRTQGYKNIDITNFSSSWEDGLAFCAVYHTYSPSSIDFDGLTPAHKKENLDLAFKTGETLGVTPTLTVEEMLKTAGPDWQRVLGYVESIYRHFEM